MDRSTVFYLLANSATQNENGEFVASDTKRAVFGDVRSVSHAEFFAAGSEGIRPEYQIAMFAPDYEGEKIAQLEIGGNLYQFAIYRTYFDGNNETVELYLADRVGVSDVDLSEDDDPTPTPEPEGDNGNSN